MYRKSIFLIPLFLCFNGLNSCTSPEKPNISANDYRYSVEVIYARTSEPFPERDDAVELIYWLQDPATKWRYEKAGIWMSKIGKNTFRCYLKQVFVQTSDYPEKHWVCVTDLQISPVKSIGENISVERAYDQEIVPFGEGTILKFKMSKD